MSGELVRILLLDEDRDCEALFMEVLKGKDYKLSVSAILDEVFEEVEKGGVDLLVIDSPKETDMLNELYLRLISIPPISRIPMLMLLNEGITDETIEKIIQHGTSDYLKKPLKPYELLSKIRILSNLALQRKRLSEFERKYRLILESIREGVFLSSRDGRFIECNDALVRMLGYESKNELMKVNIPKDIYVNPDDRKLFQYLIEKNGFVNDFKVNFKRKDGSIITVLISGQLVKDEKGEIIGYEGINIGLDSESNMWVESKEKGGRVRRFLLNILSNLIPIERNFICIKRMSELIADRYEKIEKLGDGTFSEIWKARNIMNMNRDEFCVLKIPRSEKYNRRFLKEALICKKLEPHRNAVSVKDILKHNERIIIVQEFVDGITLSDKMKIGMSEGEKRFYISQLVDIVSHAHSRNVVHRDIKPENILIRNDGILKLLDYGTAKELRDEEISKTVIGTRPYMAPEQILGKSEKRSDIWALGVIMYQIHTGRLPFYDPVEKNLMDKILEEEPERPMVIDPSIREELDNIIMKCLRKNVKERFSSGGELKEALKSISYYIENPPL